MFENMRSYCLAFTVHSRENCFSPLLHLVSGGLKMAKIYDWLLLLLSSLNQNCRLTQEPWLTYKEPHEGKYDKEGDDEDEKNHQMAKRGVALQSSLITLQNHCTVYEMTIFQQMCFLQSNYIILFWFRQHEICQCAWRQKARISLCNYIWISSFEEKNANPLTVSSTVPKSTGKKEKAVAGTWRQKDRISLCS